MGLKTRNNQKNCLAETKLRSAAYSVHNNFIFQSTICTVKLGNKERYDKEQIGINEPFPVTNLPFTS